MASNIREFTIRMQKRKDEGRQAFVRAHRALALEAIRGVVLMTPVDTGRLRGNWQMTHDAPAEGHEPNRFDRNGGPTIDAAVSVIAGIRFGEATWLHNGVPYAGIINDGTETRPGVHMVEVTAQRLRRIAKSLGAAAAR